LFLFFKASKFHIYFIEVQIKWNIFRDKKKENFHLIYFLIIIREKQLIKSGIIRMERDQQPKKRNYQKCVIKAKRKGMPVKYCEEKKPVSTNKIFSLTISTKNMLGYINSMHTNYYGIHLFNLNFHTKKKHY
jgi:hypothetical protein